jgi:ribA/ribD-fused uncharacterized protein
MEAGGVRRRSNSSVIGEFKGKYAFLSNFHAHPVKWRNQWWKWSEGPYQSEKTRDLKHKKLIWAAPTPQEAKRLGGPKGLPRHLLREDWDRIKDEVMYKVLVAKFSDAKLRKMLLDTGDAYLVEGNWWGDTYWGVCNGVGKNKLGRLLMRLRKEIRSGQHAVVNSD